jgi:phosphatidylserine/phosphatidylglycerophosphate/cardiolipin synthase-like enzyme
VKIHSKVIVVDDQIARVGSANLNNRSMGFDTECDLFLEARGGGSVAVDRRPSRPAARRASAVPMPVFQQEVARRGSIGAAIEALRGRDHTLVPLEIDRSWVERCCPKARCSIRSGRSA